MRRREGERGRKGENERGIKGEGSLRDKETER
jgi:hypothetical protein